MSQGTKNVTNKGLNFFFGVLAKAKGKVGWSSGLES